MPNARVLDVDGSWRVDSIDLRLDEREVEICLEHVGSGDTCPECWQSCGRADRREERRCTRLETLRITRESVALLRPYRCPDHGVKTIVPPCAGAHSRFALVFEASAIEDPQACLAVKAAAVLDLSLGRG